MYIYIYIHSYIYIYTWRDGSSLSGCAGGGKRGDESLSEDVEQTIGVPGVTCLWLRLSVFGFAQAGWGGGWAEDLLPCEIPQCPATMAVIILKLGLIFQSLNQCIRGLTAQRREARADSRLKTRSAMQRCKTSFQNMARFSNR